MALLSVFLGSDTGLNEWHQALTAHARWLGLEVERREVPLRPGGRVGAAWLRPEGQVLPRLWCQSGRYFMVASQTGEVEVAKGDSALERSFMDGDARALRILVRLENGSVSLRVPPATPEPGLVRRRQNDLIVSNDLRLIVRCAGLNIDRRSLWALFQYGAIPPPLTLDLETWRVPNGGICHLTPGSREVAITPSLHGDRATPVQSAASAREQIRDALDRILRDIPDRSVLLFSGGIDSGLLAARLAALGREDVRLLNYTLGEEDAHSRAARTMARHLGLNMVQLRGDIAQADAALERSALDYSFPFVDPAVITTNHLARQAVEAVSGPSAVIDGTGADGAFAFGVKASEGWRRATKVRGPLLTLGSLAYGLGIWRYPNRMEKVLRELRAIDTMPLHHATISFSPLSGIAFHAAGSGQQDVNDAISAMFTDQTHGRCLRDQLAYLDLVQTCAGRFAAKTFDPIQSRGSRPLYPFLDPILIRAAFSLPWSVKSRPGELKALLKEMFRECLPEDLAGLPKQGFVAPALEILKEPRVRSLVGDVVLRPANPVLEGCSIRVARSMFTRVYAGRNVSRPARRFLWGLVFVSLWVHGLREQLNSTG